jgi:hypothetical protein
MQKRFLRSKLVLTVATWVLTHPRLSVSVAQATNASADGPGTGIGRPSRCTCFLAQPNRSRELKS